MKGKKKFFTIIILGILSAIGPFSIDMYLPGFPSIAADLHSTVAHIALSLSSFFIGISLGQLIYGPLLDRFGRKKPMYIGLTVYFIVSVACVFCRSADLLIGLRLFQALGGCSGMVASRAMVRDLFPVSENAKIFSMLMLVIGVSPIIAPTVGGYVTAAFGWQYVFVILSALSALTLVAVHFTLPESRTADHTVSLKPAAITKSFLVIAKIPQFYTYGLTGSIAAAGLYTYIAGSPYIFMELYKVSEKQYGWIFAGIAMGLIICSQLNTFLLRKYSSEQIIPVALIFQTLAGISLVAGTVFHLLTLFSTLLLILVFLSCQGFVFPNAAALSMAPFSKNAGTASALLGCIQLAAGSITSALVSLFENRSALPMSAAMAACAAGSLLVLTLGRKTVQYKATLLEVEEESAEMISTS